MFMQALICVNASMQMFIDIKFLLLIPVFVNAYRHHVTSHMTLKVIE